MKEFGVIQTKDSDRWNDIVKRFDKYEVFYLCEYVKAFEELNKEKAILFWYDDGQTKALNVAFKRDVANDKCFIGKIGNDIYYDLQTPYGYGGMLIEGTNRTAVWDAYYRMCVEEKIICEFVRFSLFSHAEKYYWGDAEARTHNIVRNLNVDMEALYADFEHKVRKNIKKAKRNELEIVIDEKGDFFEDFLSIYYATMSRNNAKDEYYFSRSFFETFRQMKQNAAWFYVKKDHLIVSAELVLYNEKNCYSYLGGTLAEYFEYRPNELLKVAIMEWAQSRGIENFVLGGGYGTDDGIYRYKKSFAPQGIFDFYVGTKIILPEEYEYLVSIRKQEQGFDSNTTYFPKYRG